MCCVVTYAPSFFHFTEAFVGDDVEIYHNNYFFTQRTFDGYLQLITSIQWREYSPVAWTLAYLISLLSEISPNLGILVNILFHLANSMLVLLILRKTISHEAVCLATAAFFLVCPMAADLVTILSGIFWLSAWFFCLLSVYFFAEGRSIPSLISLSAGLLCKSSAVQVVIILLFVLYVSSDRRRHLKLFGKIVALVIGFGLALEWFIFTELPKATYAGGSLLISFFSHLPHLFENARAILFPIEWISGDGWRISLSPVYDTQTLANATALIMHLIGSPDFYFFVLLISISFFVSKKISIIILIFCLLQLFYSGISQSQLIARADRYSYPGIWLLATAFFSLLNIFSMGRAKVFNLTAWIVLLFQMYISMQYSFILSASETYFRHLERSGTKQAALELSGVNQIHPFQLLKRYELGLTVVPAQYLENFKRIADDRDFAWPTPRQPKIAKIILIVALDTAIRQGKVELAEEFFLSRIRRLSLYKESVDIVYQFPYLEFYCATGKKTKCLRLFEGWRQDKRSHYEKLLEVAESGVDKINKKELAKHTLLARGNQLHQNFIYRNYLLTLLLVRDHSTGAQAEEVSKLIELF